MARKKAKPPDPSDVISHTDSMPEEEVREYWDEQRRREATPIPLPSPSPPRPPTKRKPAKDEEE